jgi:hypothetical protein
MEQRSRILLTPIKDLCRLFQAEAPSGIQSLSGHEPAAEEAAVYAPVPSPDGLTSVFEGCIARLESAGLVKRLRFGDYVLLQPELLDAYAGAMENAAKDEPDGLGSILEAKVVNVDFPVPAAERVPDQLQERLLVLAPWRSCSSMNWCSASRRGTVFSSSSRRPTGATYRRPRYPSETGSSVGSRGR